MKRCLHRKVDFKTNELNNAHVPLLFYYKAGLLQNDGIIIYLQIKTNSSQMDTSHRTVLDHGSEACTFHYINKIIKKTPFPSTLLNVNLVKYGPRITINVPVVYMGRYEVVLRGDYP